MDEKGGRAHLAVHAPALDLEELEKYLKILADLSRLRLLDLLRKARTIDEIQLSPHRQMEGQVRERPMTRQAIRNHLYQMTEAGLVRVRLARRESRRSLQEFVIDRSRIFAIVEAMNDLSRIEALERVDPGETVALEGPRQDPTTSGPRLVHVNGPHEGRNLPLDPSRLGKGRGWVLGRGTHCALRIEYDPYISREHAEVLADPGGFRLLDLRSGRNATFVNWTPLPKGGESMLRHGDVLRLGRSSLLFADD